MQVEDTKPWYQQFWPWAVMFLPATAVVAGLYTYSLAASGSSGLVVDDYYKAGQAINRSLAHGQRAADMGLIGNLALNGQVVRLLLNNAQVESQQQLVLKLSHATIPGHDQSVNLRKTGAGEWSGKLQALPAAGKWYVDLLPMDESWRLEGTMPSAQVTALELKPAL
jgi:hypothetical protein